jgi:limonene-1,2-epoxide hydrolase
MDKPLNENLEVVRKWLSAVNAHDIKQIINTLHPDYEYDLEYSSIKGREAAEEGWKLFLAGFTDFHYEVVLMIGSDEYVVSRLRMKGKHTGPFRFIGTDSLEKPILPKNNPVDIPTCAIHKIEEGKIIRMWSYWDTATLLRQMEA